MVEPVGPEAYLAIAASVHDTYNTYSSYREKKRNEQNQKPKDISTASSNSSLTLPTDQLLSYAGLKAGNDGYVHWATNSAAHPRNWSRRRKAYDLGLILFSEFCMSGISAVGIPATLDWPEVLGHHSREV